MAGYDGRGARFDIIGVKGADLSFTVTAVDGAAAAIDLSAATITATVYNGAGVVVDTFTATVSGAGSNVITLSLTDTEVDALVAPRTWALEVSRGGDDRVWLAGAFSVQAPSFPRTSTSGTAVTATLDTNAVVTANVLTAQPRVTVSSTPPVDPDDDDLWVDDDDLTLYVRYGGVWVALSGPAGIDGADGDDGDDGVDGDAANAAHLATTTGAHAASAISVADVGNLYAADNVEAALAEVKTVADAAGGGVSLGQARTNPADGDIGWSSPLGATTTTITLAEGQMIGVPLTVANNATVDRIRIGVTAQGTAGAVVRLGIYQLSTSSRNTHALVVDGGTVDATTTGIKTVTISQALTTDKVYLLVAVAQGAAATRPTVTAITGGVPIVGNAGATLAPLSAGYAGNGGSAAGALPATTTGGNLLRGTYENPPLLGVRFA